jgi:predicted metal-dependent hydrolase
MPHKNILEKPEQLQLFPETEIDHLRKERIVKMLENELAAPVDVELTRNRSAVLYSRKRTGSFQVRMHQVFLLADRRVIRAVADLIRKGSKPARVIINEYIKLHQKDIMRQKSARAIVLEPKGKVYDLEKILRELAKKYDLHPRRIKITWSRSRIRKGQQTIRLGSYNHDERLIRVHSSLDQASVPQYFVEYIVYHELLHALVPPENKRGKKDFHPPEYHKLEQKFEHFKEARKFEKYITSHWL